MMGELLRLLASLVIVELKRAIAKRRAGSAPAPTVAPVRSLRRVK